MDKILITGAAGLIGSILSENLKHQGYDVIDCDIRFHDNPLDFASKDIISLLEECKGIIHLSGIARVIHGEKYPELCKEINVNSTMQLLEVYKNLKNKPWLIYGSSREVYGQQKKLPVHENANFKPVNIYAECKITIENLISDLRKNNYNTLILRFSNVYGGMLDHYNRVVPAFCLGALKNNPIKVEGGECIFDFTYVQDVVDGICLAIREMQNNALSEDLAIHFTGRRGCSLKELVDIILDLTNSNSKIEYFLARNFDVGKFYGDYSLASKLLKWEPKHSLEEGLNKFIYDIKNSSKRCPYNLEMAIYENIKSYSWLPALL